jgi:NADH-quinone oxidoreductase subunit F
MCPTIRQQRRDACAVKHIVEMGAANYAKLGTQNNTGTRIVSLSGDVKNPGYYEIEGRKSPSANSFSRPSAADCATAQLKRHSRGSRAKFQGGAEMFKIKKRARGPGDRRWTCSIPYDFDTLIAAVRCRFQRRHRDGRFDRHRRGARNISEFTRTKLRPMHACREVRSG